MEYKYFTLDKNPKQFKRISIGEYSIELRIEWNTRSKAWYVLGYSGDEIVISNVKLTPNQLYSIDIDSEYDLPYMIGIIPKYTNYDWDTETTFLIVDNPLSNTVEGLTVDGGVIERSIATSSDTHSRKALKGTENKYLFDVVSITQETGITIICNGADASFKTVNLPQGRWDFTINGMRTITANTEAFRSLMNDYGVQIVDVGNNEYLWANNSDYEIKIEGLYPYAAGYDFNVAESSNESAKIHSVDNNGWVNRFTVCLTPFVDTVWEVYKTEVSEDYNNLVFKGRKSLTGVKPSEEEALLEKYKSGIDPYSTTIINELTGVSDWVLDSDNNQIKYYIDNPPNDVNDPSLQYYWESQGRKSTTPEAAALEGAISNPYVCGTTNCVIYPDPNRPATDTSFHYCAVRSGQLVGCAYLAQRLVNPNYNPNVESEREEKTLPLDVVVTQVISNAANGDVNAKELLNSLNKYDSYAEVEILPLIVDQYKQGIDVYSSTIVNELTGVSDWILDSDNNQIKYTLTASKYRYNFANYDVIEAETYSQACYLWSKKYYGEATEGWGSTFIDGKQWCTDSSGWRNNHITSKVLVNTDTENKSISYTTIAQKIISNAESGNVDAQKVVLSAALSPTLMSSLSDSDMQQWQAVKDAIGGLTGVSSWTFDNVDEVVRYAVINPDLNAVASTLTQRHSKSPSNFVGKDAFTALIEGIGWAMGEDGVVTKPDETYDPAKYTSQYMYYVTYDDRTAYTPQGACSLHAPKITSSINAYSFKSATETLCTLSRSRYGEVYPDITFPISTLPNPDYQQPPTSESIVVSSVEIETALKNALESNNPDLTATISGAITAAYTYDVVGFNELYDSLSVTYQQVADKIITNSNVEDQGVSLLAQAYIQEAFRSAATGDVESQLNSNIYNFGVKDVIIEYVDGSIKSTWVSFGFPESVSYYRSNTTMNPDNMPSPLNTGLKDLNSFTEQVVINAREYIRFGTVKNNREVISEEFIIEPPLSPLTGINFEVIEE